MSQNKLIILFILDNSPIELSEVQILEVISKLDLLNYFDFKEIMYEFEQTGAIYSKENPHDARYKTTKIGSEIVQTLCEEINYSQREKILRYLETHKDNFLRQSQFLGEVLRLKNEEYRVTLKIYENYMTLFEINVIVPTESMGYTLIKNWQEQATDVYKDILLRLS